MFGPVLTAMVTPFKANGDVDYVAFRTLARYLVEHGSDGLVVTGSTGEAPTLSDRERLLLYALPSTRWGSGRASSPRPGRTTRGTRSR